MVPVPWLGLGVLLSGCLLLDGGGGPETAQVTVSLESGGIGAGSNLRLIVSNNFFSAGAEGQANITLRSADTIQLTDPFEQQYSLGSEGRFFAQFANLDSIPVVLSIKVALDGEVRMDQTSALGEPVEFLYILREF